MNLSLAKLNLNSSSNKTSLNKAIKNITEPSSETAQSEAQRYTQSPADNQIALLGRLFPRFSRRFNARRSHTNPQQNRAVQQSWQNFGAQTSPQIPKTNFVNNNNSTRPPSNHNNMPNQGPLSPELPNTFTTDLDKLVPNPDGVKLSQSEFEVIRQTNALRVAQGKAPLIVKQNLTDTARLSSQRMNARNQMVHRLTNGWRGENIAMGQRNSEQVVRAWKNSSGHYRNMMSSGFKYIGVGDTIDQGGKVFWTQQFA